MGELKNRFDKHYPDYAGLGFYVVFGALLRWITCNWSNVSIANYSAIVFILVGITFGLYSFISRNRPPPKGIRKIIFEAGRGMLTGFSVGWGGVTVWILAGHPCG